MVLSLRNSAGGFSEERAGEEEEEGRAAGPALHEIQGNESFVSLGFVCFPRRFCRFCGIFK